MKTINPSYTIISKYYRSMVIGLILLTSPAIAQDQKTEIVPEKVEVDSNVGRSTSE